MLSRFLLLPLLATLLLSACDSSEKPTASYGQIDKDRLLNIEAEPGAWLTPGRDFQESYYSPLTQIDRDNVGRLGLAWEYHTGTDRGLEATPIVVDGVMYTSGIQGRVYALDAASGEELWTFDPEIDHQVHRKTCCDQVNRGVVVWEGRVYVASLDGYLYALDAADGDVIWEVDTIDEPERGYSITGAPAIAGDVVVIGNAGAELDARGYITAYDLVSGDEAWRFYTVPRDPALGQEHPALEMAVETWDPNSRWDVGLGGTAWDALVYDPILELLYVGTGNAALWNYAERSPAGGDNLFLTSILAIDPKDGSLAWHYQQVPGDRWDYTATQPIILADILFEGEQRKVLMQAPKNGYFYILDRETGEFLSAENFVPVNWGTVDPDTGVPTVDEDAVDWTRQGPKLIFPSAMGGHNWHPMSYSQHSGLVYIPAIEAGMVQYANTEPHVHQPGGWNTGVNTIFGQALPTDPATAPGPLRALIASGELYAGQPDTTSGGYLRAWDPIQQEAVWEVETAGTWDRAGVMSTGGGLVFSGTATGYFRAYDDRSGEILREIEVGTSIMAAPMSYTVAGEQYIAVMAGWGGGGWNVPPPESAAWQRDNAGRLLVFKLDGDEVPLPSLLEDPGPIPEPPESRVDAETIEQGAALFGQYCATCHAMTPRTGSADLRRMSATVHDSFESIVLGGAYKPLGMPQFDDVLNSADAQAIRAYLIGVARRDRAAEAEN